MQLAVEADCRRSAAVVEGEVAQSEGRMPVAQSEDVVDSTQTCQARQDSRRESREVGTRRKQQLLMRHRDAA